MAGGPHPESVIRTATGRVVPLKAHRCIWSGAYPGNSLPAIAECHRATVARAEIDLQMLRDADFLVFHDSEVDDSTTGSGAVGALTRREAESLRLLFGGAVSAERPPLFSEVVGLIRDLPSPTLLELDLITSWPLPWPRAEELARLIAPVKDRVFVNGSDWNVRRLVEVDATMPVAFDIYPYLDWAPPEGDPAGAELALPRGAYGYLDAHPLARERLTSAADYVVDRLGGLLGLAPTAREIHVRLTAFERMLDDGAAVAGLVHRRGMLLDVWTLNAETPNWHERLSRALAAGVDVITTDTPRALAASGVEV